jgi:hypothetical protein
MPGLLSCCEFNNKLKVLLVPRGGVRLLGSFKSLACPTFASRPIGPQSVFLRLSHHQGEAILFGFYRSHKIGQLVVIGFTISPEMNAPMAIWT